MIEFFFKISKYFSIDCTQKKTSIMMIGYLCVYEIIYDDKLMKINNNELNKTIKET